MSDDDFAGYGPTIQDTMVADAVRRITTARAEWMRKVIGILTDLGVRREEIELRECADGRTQLAARGRVYEFRVHLVSDEPER